MLSQAGNQFYNDYSTSLKSLFGDFVLCSDNFAVEHRQGDKYLIPKFNVSSTQNDTNNRLFDESVVLASNRRQYYAEILHSLLRKFPTTQFVLRPHPIADPRWWLNEFWKYRNFHLIYQYNVEPWLHACKTMISFGCTTSVQALIANKPVIELSPSDIHNELKYGNASGYSHLFTPYVVRDEDDAKSALASILSNSQINFSSKYDLNHYWFIDENQSRVNYFSGEISRTLSTLPSMSGSRLSDVLNSYVQNKVSSENSF